MRFNVTKSIVTDVNEVHPVNALSTILVTVFGIVIDINAVHPENASFPILFTTEGVVNITDVNALHPVNILAPILVTVFGIVIDNNLLQLLNALSPIFVIVGVTVNVIDVKLVQLLNALAPILFTVFGMVIDVNAVHSENTLAPIIVTVFGMVIEVNTLSDCNAVEVKLRVGPESFIDNVIHDGKLIMNDADNVFNVVKFIVTDVNAVHPVNALSTILVTVFGIVIDVNLLLFCNAVEVKLRIGVDVLSLIDNVVHDRKILVNEVMRFNVAKSIVTDVILLPILVPILVTLGGINIIFNAVHPENALVPIFVIVAVDVKVIDVNAVQLSNAESAMFLTDDGIIHDNKLSRIVFLLFLLNKILLIMDSTVLSNVETHVDPDLVTVPKFI